MAKPKPKRKPKVGKPWIKLGISRSTYYRDQLLSKRNDANRNTK